MKVTKEVTFDSAHMLSNYSGKCKNLHGHTYKLQVSVEGKQQTEGNEECMVLDFNALKRALEYVTDAFDHAIIFSDVEHRGEAEDALYDWAEKFSMNFIVVNGKSTSENIAQYIEKTIYEILDMPGITVGIRLWETPTSFAEV